MDYKLSLKGSVRNRYEEKIGICDGLDPFLIKFSDDIGEIPRLEPFDVVNYLTSSTSYYTGKQAKAYKSLDAYKFYEANYVHDILVKYLIGKTVVVGKVRHSQRTTLPPLHAWTVYKNDGEVICGHCTCMVGCGEVCSHIGALLYTIEANTRDAVDKSCTDRAACWPVPTMRCLEMAKIQDIYFGVKQTRAKVLQPTLPQFSLQEIQEILQEMSDTGDTCALATIVSPFNEEYETFDDVDDPSSDDPETLPSTEDISFKEIIKKIICSNDFLNDMEYELPEDINESNHYFQNNLKLTDESSSKLCLETITQDNGQWVQERRRRITASKCYSLFTYFSNKNPDWSKKIQGYLNPKNYFAIKNMQYGVETESLARQCYIQQSGQNVTQVGFFVHPTTSWLGCSPDGIVVNENILIEIKCPVHGEMDNFDDFCEKIKYLEQIDGHYKLKEKHAYFGQIQLSLFLLNMRRCDFILYCKKEDKCLIVQVPFKESFVNNLVKTLTSIYFEFILPELIKESG